MTTAKQIERNTVHNYSGWFYRLGESLRLLWLIFDPRREQAQKIYKILSQHNNLAERSLYLNLGYWKHARGYDQACQALAEKLGQLAGLQEGDRILDAGCGFGDQDRLFIERFKVKSIKALNVCDFQLEEAKLRHPFPSIEWLNASATELPFPRASFDKVLALESAFHFQTREIFFKEAFRALIPGGTLALADIAVEIKARNWQEKLIDAVGHKMWQVPKANLYSMDVYRKLLAQQGFCEIEIEDISKDVYQPFADFARSRVRDPIVKRRLNPLLKMAWTAPHEGMNRTAYILVRAKKPG